jgi:hypothetical protein
VGKPEVTARATEPAASCRASPGRAAVRAPHCFRRLAYVGADDLMHGLTTSLRQREKNVGYRHVSLGIPCLRVPVEKLWRRKTSTRRLHLLHCAFGNFAPVLAARERRSWKYCPTGAWAMQCKGAV